MIDFNFISKTKIFFGEDKENNIGKIISDYGFKNIAFIYGKGSIKANGLYDRIIDSLNKNNINFYEFGGVEANPKLSFVNKAIGYLKDKNIELILAVGGGSAIDSAKLISHAMYYEKDPFDFNNGIAKNLNPIPVGIILTISAAGSELSDSCVITNDYVNPFIKKGFNSDTNRPLFVIENPKLTYSVNKFQTGCGIVDIMMHTLERYMNPTDSCKFSENLAIGLLKTVLDSGYKVIQNPNDYEARANLMIASSFSHNGLTGLGKKQVMRVHGLEHVLSGCYDFVAHGAGLSVLWPAWCYYNLDNIKANELLTKLAKKLFNKNTAKEGIDALKEYFDKIGMPTSFTKLDPNTNFDFEKMALVYSNNKQKVIKDFNDLDYNAFIAICNLAK